MKLDTNNSVKGFYVLSSNNINCATWSVLEGKNT